MEKVRDEGQWREETSKMALAAQQLQPCLFTQPMTSLSSLCDSHEGSTLSVIPSNGSPLREKSALSPPQDFDIARVTSIYAVVGAKKHLKIN